jgi:hypothetical protein
LYLSFALLVHEALVADVGKEKSLVDDDVGGVLVRGGLGGGLVGVPLSHNMCLTALLLLHLLLSLVPVPIIVTSIWTFCNIVIGLTTLIANPLGMGFVLLPLPLLEDLSEALDG